MAKLGRPKKKGETLSCPHMVNLTLAESRAVRDASAGNISAWIRKQVQDALKRRK